jgi:hypothetical protein
MGRKLDNHAERNFAVTPFRSKASVLIRERPIPEITIARHSRLIRNFTSVREVLRAKPAAICLAIVDVAIGAIPSCSIISKYLSVLLVESISKNACGQFPNSHADSFFDGSAFSNCAKNATHLTSVRFSRLAAVVVVVVVIRHSMDINSFSPRGEEWLESGRNQGK